MIDPGRLKIYAGAVSGWVYAGYGISGYSGYSGVGTSGYSGAGESGYSGYSGTSGYSGYSGESGVSGYSGFSGYSGDSPGTSGYSGVSGYSGESGYSGYSGTSGLPGGTSGYSGYSGEAGTIGTSGYSGYSGISGYSGLGQGYNTTFTNADLAAGILSVTHNLNLLYNSVQVFNGSNQMVLPDGVTLLTTNSLTVDLSSYGTITGTWAVSVTNGGGLATSGYSGYSGQSGTSGLGLSGYSGYSGRSGYSGNNTVLILDPVPSINQSANGVKANLVAGEQLYFGYICRVNSSGKMVRADADTIATSSVIAIALETIAVDTAGSFLLLGFVRDDSWTFTIGEFVYLSTTLGAVTQTAPSATGEVIQILGIATQATRMYFNPNLVQVEHV